MSKAQTGHVTVFLVAAVCLAGGPTLAQPEFTIVQLPEGGGTASEPLAMHVGNDPPEITVVGRVRDASGIWQAAMWTRQGGQVFVLDITFHDPTTDSDAVGVGDVNADGRPDLIVGSQGGPGSELPKVWRLDESGSLGCTWCEDTVNLPAGFLRGKVKDDMGGDGDADRVAGWSAGSDGVQKATVWEWDGTAWQPTLLPELATDPVVSRSSVARGFKRDDDFDGNDYTYGSAEDDNGDEKPVIWIFSLAAGSWSVTELPLLPGGISGDIRDGTIDGVNGTVTLFGSSETNPDGLAPVRHAAYWQCSFRTADCTLPASWTVVDLPVPALKVHCRSYCYMPQTANLAGTCDAGAGTEVATIWEVDLGVTPAAVTVHDVNSLVSNLPANVTLTQALAIIGRGTVATGKVGTDPAGAAAGVTGPHAFLLETVESAAIPTVGTWGMAVLALLVLGIGTAIVRQRQSLTLERLPNLDDRSNHDRLRATGTCDDVPDRVSE